MVHRGTCQGIQDGPVPHLGTGVGELCTVSAVLDYMVRRGLAAGPFFAVADGKRLTHEHFVKVVREAMDHPGTPDIASGSGPQPQQPGTDFRIGAATTAARYGLQDSLIKTLGRWESAAYMVYIHTPRETLCAVSRTLAGPPRH